MKKVTRFFEIFTKSYDIAVINPKTYNYVQYLHNRLCIPDCEIYVKNDVEGKYFPETEQDGCPYRLMTEEEELLQVKIIKGLQTDETVVTIKRED